MIAARKECPHGFKLSTQLCVVASCPAYDGRGKVAVTEKPVPIAQVLPVVTADEFLARGLDGDA